MIDRTRFIKKIKSMIVRTRFIRNEIHDRLRVVFEFMISKKYMRKKVSEKISYFMDKVLIF